MPKRDTVLVTGASGMLGYALWRSLAKRCRLIGADSAAPRAARYERFIETDVTDGNSFQSMVVKARPDVLIHAAAMTNVDGCERDPKRAYLVNSLGAGNAARAARRAKARLIYISTDFIFDGKKGEPYTELDTPRPLSVYGDSKREGEIVIRQTLKEHYIVRTSWLYGAHGTNFVDTIAAKASGEATLKVVDDQVGSPTYAKDLADAIAILLGSNLEDGTYHIANRGSISWCAYARKIIALSGSRAKVTPISSAELGRPAARPAMSALDVTKFEHAAGHTMRRWDDALVEYLSSGKAKT